MSSHPTKAALQSEKVTAEARRKSERSRRRRIKIWWRRKTQWMTSTSSRKGGALPSTESFDERLRDVFTFDKATPVLNEYLSSIQIDDDDPGLVLSWDMDNLIEFVEAATTLNHHPDPPGWLRTPPSQITINSFTDDVVLHLSRVAGGSCGRVPLAPNTQAQFFGIAWT